MTSPFTTFANATLVFQLPTGVVTVNSVGNRVVETGPVEIKAMLKPVRDAAEVNYYVGDDATAELMSGYLVDPTSLPDNLHPPVEGKAEVITALGRTESGDFKLMPRSQSPYIQGVGIGFLNKVYGIFRRG